MGMVEAMVAAAVLLGGLLSTFLVLDGSRDLTTVSERKEVAVHRAERELERVQAIPYAQLELAAQPTAATPGDALDPRALVSGTNYDWDLTSATNPLEALVIKAPAATNPDAITSRQTWSDGRMSGTLDTFVTTAATGLKRVTVAVRLDGTQRPRSPIYMSTLVSQQAGA